MKRMLCLLTVLALALSLLPGVAMAEFESVALETGPMEVRVNREKGD